MWTIRIIIVPPASLVRHLPNSSLPPKSGQPPASWWSSPSARRRWQQRWHLVPRRPDLRHEQRAPPATTPGATQQPQVTGAVQNPVASSQTAGSLASSVVELQQINNTKSCADGGADQQSIVQG
ncbi:hypothetical protein PVAP13_8NG173302 [Panicum virgatum]|uniref:Uncharacterized protein n=1 Tax=Panicum virgatum TaxID=38727 RepID=A0A8T0P897_PANVG|nr:hypothetical protein PVAP13_8NG173302 [Panicum virgatum]